jgi:hypothetical protein
LGAEAAACGICCRYCPVYELKEKGCEGCDWVNDKLRKVRESHEGCAFWECAKEKNVKCCFLCSEFPWKLHYGKEAIYASEALNMWKDHRRGTQFW